MDYNELIEELGREVVPIADSLRDPRDGHDQSWRTRISVVQGNRQKIGPAHYSRRNISR